MFSMFREAPTESCPKGQVSMRRVLAAYFAAISLIAGLLSIIKEADWKIIAISFGLPIIAALLLLFFTTWSDIASAIKTIKSDNQQ
jgi:hypothetical protein